MPVTTVADLKTCKRIRDVQLRLELGDDSRIRQLAKELENFFEDDPLYNIVIADCHSEDVRDWTSPPMAHFFEAVGNLPNVVQVQFESLGTGSRSDDDDDENLEPLSIFPIDIMTNLLRKWALRLECLSIESSVLTGFNRGQMDDFCSAIGNLKSCRCLYITSNFDLHLQPQHFDPVEDDPSYPLDDVVAAIAKLPLLIDVSLITYAWYEAGFPVQFSSSEPIKELMQSPSILYFNLGEFQLANEGLKDVVRALGENQTAKKLELNFSPSPTRTALKSLSMLSNALKRNKSLESLKLHFDEACPKLDPFLLKIADALSTNKETSLKKLKVTSPMTYGAEVEEAFCNTLQSNYSLQKLDFMTVESGDEDEEENVIYFEGHKKTEIDLLLRLNSGGRASLVRNNGVSRGKWIRTLHEFTNDLDALHLYLKMNPWLCHPPGDDDTQQASPSTTTSKVQGSTPMITTTSTVSNRPLPTTTTTKAITTRDTTPAMLQGLQQLITCGFQTTQGELQQLHTKIDVMNQQHAKEKKELQDEVKRLREEVAALKQRNGA